MPTVVNQILKAKSAQENFPQIFGFLQKKCWEGKRVANKKIISTCVLYRRRLPV